MKQNKQVYMYRIAPFRLVKYKHFKTTKEMEEFTGISSIYINHNLKYCDKLRFKGEWYKISRTPLKSEDY